MTVVTGVDFQVQFAKDAFASRVKVLFIAAILSNSLTERLKFFAWHNIELALNVTNNSGTFGAQPRNNVLENLKGNVFPKVLHSESFFWSRFVKMQPCNMNSLSQKLVSIQRCRISLIYILSFKV